MISVIVTTRNRMPEVKNFLAHLDCQTYRDFELLIADQNASPGVAETLKQYSFRQRYFPSNERGASRGRNIGLRAAQGDILAIPDDDCWYPPDLLATINAWFAAHPEIEMLCILECNPNGEAMVPQNPPPAGFCTDQPVGLFPERSVWMAQSSMVFLRRKVLDTIGVLDENLGVGCDTKYQSGEETDYYLRAMRAGFKMWFEPSIKVFHVELRTPERLRRSNYPYSVGTGRVLRMHGCRLTRVLAVVARAFGGAGVSLLKFKFPETMAYLRRGFGILLGYFT